MKDQIKNSPHEKNDESPHRHEKGDGAGRVLIICLVLVGLVFFYIASVGPAVWLWDKMGWDYEMLQYIYAPVIWLHENTPLRKPLEWWVNLFE